MRQVVEYTLFDSTKLLQAAFTAATTDIVTCTGHGFVTGDKIRVTTSAGDLPAGLAINTDYYVVKIGANTFYLNSTPSDDTASRIDITDAGTGTHTLHLKSRVIDVDDFRHATLSWHTANSFNATTKVQGSRQEDVDFEAAASATNRWDYIQVINNEDGSTVDGDTGISPTVAGTDDNFEFAVNVDGMKLLCLDVSSWTAGTLAATLSLFND